MLYRYKHLTIGTLISITAAESTVHIISRVHLVKLVEDAGDRTHTFCLNQQTYTLCALQTFTRIQNGALGPLDMSVCMRMSLEMVFFRSCP